MSCAKTLQPNIFDDGSLTQCSFVTNKQWSVAAAASGLPFGRFRRRRSNNRTAVIKI